METHPDILRGGQRNSYQLENAVFCIYVSPGLNSLPGSCDTQVGEFRVSWIISTVPLTWFSGNTVFSKNKMRTMQCGGYVGSYANINNIFCTVRNSFWEPLILTYHRCRARTCPSGGGRLLQELRRRGGVAHFARLHPLWPPYRWRLSRPRFELWLPGKLNDELVLSKTF